MQAESLPRACARFLAVLADLQDQTGGAPVALSPAEWACVTGIPERQQILVRQRLMLAGLLRLSAASGRWVYALEERAV